jgi:AcrR family transcriptional regulator
MATVDFSTIHPPGRRGTYAKTVEKRRVILEAALEVFSEGGYRSGSLRDIAERVGMSEAGLLHHFPNKSALLAAVLDRRDQHSVELVPIGELSPRETLRGLAWLAFYNASVPGVVELYCTLSAEATSADHPAHEYFISRYAVLRKSLETVWGDLAADGDLRPGVDPAKAARNTLALMDGLQVQWLLDRESVDMAEQIVSFFEGMTTFTFGDVKKWKSGIVVGPAPELTALAG